jgi:two-component system NtrC family response regulator
MRQPDPRRVLVIEDDSTLNRLLVEQLTRLGYEAQGAGSRAAALEVLAGLRPDLAILDLRLPDADGLTFLPELREYCPAIVLTAQGSIDRAVQAVRAGAADFLVKPATGQALELAVNRVLGTADLQRDLAFWQGQARVAQDRPIIGTSPQMAEVRRLISLFAGAEAPVLILGEAGSGKERCAMALHSLSPRSNGRFVSIDCDAGPTAEELLGEMHAGPGGRVTRSEGLLAAADTGTVYLGGVDRLAHDLQTKLLRIIETGSYRPVGSNALVACPARFVLGSDLTAADIAARHDHQSPLLYRMLSFVIQVPALRDRPGDIRLMAETFLETRNFQRNTPKSFSPEAIRALQGHRWPGNLRELSNAVERAIIMSAGDEVIGPEHLGLGPAQAFAGRTQSGEVVLRFAEPPSLEDLRAAYLRLLLDMTRGNRREMAAILGISERNLYRLLPHLADPDA